MSPKVERILKFLLVDDDSIDRSVCRMALQEGPWKIEFDEVDTVQTAHRKLMANVYDCVILDRFLPDGDGQSLLRVLHGLDAPPAVVFVTGHASEDSAVIAIRGGAQDYVSKDRIEADLVRSVNYALVRKELEDELRKANTRLEALSQHDPLTGLLNRRGFEARLGLELLRADRDLTPLTAVVVDVDLFKQVNDAHGHAMGDRILVAIARQIELACRATDHCARIGGDEFLALLPNVSLLEARNIAERLRMHVHNIAIPAPTGVLKATVSMAVTDVPGDVKTTSDILSYTQFALSQSKQRGRDCISIASTGRQRRPQRGERSLESIRQQPTETTFDVEIQPIIRLLTGEIVGRDLRLVTRRGAEISERAVFAAAFNDNRLVEMDLAYLRRRVEHAESFDDFAAIHVAVFADTLLSDRIDELGLLVVGVTKQRPLVIGLDTNLLPPDFTGLAKRVEQIKAAGAKIELLDVGAGGDAIDAVLGLRPDYARLSADLLQAVTQGRDGVSHYERMYSVLRALRCEVIADGVDRAELRRFVLDLKVPYALGRAAKVPASMRPRRRT